MSNTLSNTLDDEMLSQLDFLMNWDPDSGVLEDTDELMRLIDSDPENFPSMDSWGDNHE